MAGHYINTIEDENTGRPVNGATIKVYQDGATVSGDNVTTGTLATIYSDDGVTTIDQTNDPLTTIQDGRFEFYTDQTRVVIAVLFNGVGIAVWNDIDVYDGTGSGDVTTLGVRVDNHDTLFGTAANATDLGTFTGSIISDNAAVKTALQELETDLDLAPRLADPDADRLIIWDDSAGGYVFTSAVFIDSATGNVGIGTETITNSAGFKRLSINDTSGAILEHKVNGTATGRLLTSASSVSLDTLASIPLTLKTNSVTRMTIDASGNVTVGSVNVLTESLTLACSDESTAISATGTKLTFRMPFAMTLTSVRASLNSACSTGTFTVDINEGGTTILSTKLTIDATEKTSTTAAAAAVISDSALADDAEITIDVDDVGDGTATGLKITLIGTRA